ncbi:SDR family NAD(P)-dependent oxidoreductase [Desulfovibrio sp. OttesenSCG-928-A18]|nr:SDR family NAD(P)-dependent oxidoreductase [Desulfovibrio sp. OttesenSCG-928-A18]
MHRSKKPNQEPIAIIGASCRFPGGANGLGAYWRLLENGTDAVTELGAERFSLERFCSADRELAGHSYTRAAGVLENIKDFDPDFFGISRKEAAHMDIQQRLVLEAAWETMESAHLLPSDIQGSDTAVFIGASNVDNSLQAPDDPEVTSAYSMTGSNLSIISNRLSYFFDLHGPSMTIDTACSSSLVAVHEACQCLRYGKADMALAGGVNALIAPYAFIGFSRARMLSPDGRCKVFDASGNGYVRSEGVGMILLKPLGAALKDGNAILGLIAASGVNSDGRTTGIALPNTEAQAALLTRVYDGFGLDRKKLVYMEAHGTGTAAGDPLEALAIGKVLGKALQGLRPLPVGSVKSNIGHLESASGMAGLLKSLLVLQQGEAPANLHFHTPNPDIDFTGLNLFVPTQLTRLADAGGEELAGINSFGFGGTNAHVVLQKAPKRPVRRFAARRGAVPPPIFLSAKSPASLCSYAESLARSLDNSTAAQCYDSAATLALSRTVHPVRSLIQAGTVQDICAQLRRIAKIQDQTKLPAAVVSPLLPGKGVFAYSGNGSQWLGMGTALLRENALFRQGLEKVDALLCPLQGWSLMDVFHNPQAHAETFEHTEKCQSMLFAMQVALTESFAAQGLYPSAVIGHSVGELAAAWASGALSLEDAVRVLYMRSKLQGPMRGSGAMAVANMSMEKAAALLADYGESIEISAENTHNSLTLSGQERPLRAFVDQCKRLRVAAKMLRIPYPFHTKAMDGIRADFLEGLKQLRPRKAKIPFFSTVTGEQFTGLLDKEYWYRNIRQPVLFARAIEAAFEQGFRLFLEVGPSPILRSYMRDLFRQESVPVSVTPTLFNNDNEVEDFAGAWKNAWENGWALDLKRHFPLPHERVTLPAYAWNREFTWPEDTPENRGHLKAARVHPLLGWSLPGKAHVFENTLLPADFPWLGDHVAGAGAVYPAAAFLESMLAAARQVYPEQQSALERITIFRPLPLADSAPKVVRLGVDREDGGLLMEARQHMSAEPWGRYARARIVPSADSPGDAGFSLETPEHFGIIVSKRDLYNTASRFLLHYGPAFQTVARAWSRPEPEHPEVLVQFEEPVPESVAGMLIPPPLIDGALQSLFILLSAQYKGQVRAYLPVNFERVIMFESGKPRFAHAKLERVSPRSVVATFRLFDGMGKTLLILRNCRFRRAAWLEHERAASSPYSVMLVPSPHPDSVSPLSGIATGDMAVEAQKCISDTAARTNAETGQGTHPYLLLQLAALTYAHEQVFQFLGPQSKHRGIEDLLESGLLHPSQELWFQALLERLENADLVVRQNERIQVQAPKNTVNAKTLWRTLVSNAPGYLPEAVLLSHIAGNMRDILAGRYAGEEQSILPQKLVRQYFSSSSSLRPFTVAAKHCLKAVLSTGKSGDLLNILHIADEPAAMLPDILPFLAAHPCRWVVAERDEVSAEAQAMRFSTEPSLSFGALELEDPAEEHIGRYHCIFMAWTLHSRLNSARVLERCRDMLAPGGVICLLEHCPDMFTDLVFGSSPAWWAASPENSLPVPLMQETDYWRESLEKVGFAACVGIGGMNEGYGSACLLFGRKSAPQSGQADANRTQAARPDKSEQQNPEIEKQAEKNTPAPVCLIISGPEDSESAALARALHGKLLEAEMECAIASCPAAGPEETDAGDAWLASLQERMQGWADRQLQLIFAAGYDTREDLRLEELAAIQQQGLFALCAVARAWDRLRTDTRLFVITGGALTDGAPDVLPVPSQGALCGFARVLGNELRALRCTVIDAHGAILESKGRIAALARELLRPTDENEIVLTANARYVPRMKRFTPRTDSAADAETSGALLTFDSPGRLQNLYWKSMPLPKPGPGEVCVEVRYTGLNFRDVMWSMGMLLDEALENGFSGPTMGIECSGIIRSVGQGVTGWKPGDAVLGFTPAGFSSHVLTRATAIARKPDNISLSQAATIPVAFITAWYSLKHLARMQPGERILIHGAAGGVGLAAVQIAAHLGLEVHATVGSAEKRSFLRSLGVSNLYSSRSLAFAQEVMDNTQGQGVDAVLNSLVGEAIPAGLSVLRPFGRFIELGKRDFYADTPMRLRPFSNNLSYFGVDVDQLIIHQPELARTLFAELIALFAERKLAPLPHTLYPVTRTVDAFQAMQQSAHTGKLVVSLAGAASIAKAPEETQIKLKLRPDASYLVSGGTGGFGLASALRLARRGAKHLLLLSRNGVKDEESAGLIEEMRANGVQVTIARTDVADQVKLQRCLDKVLKQMPPLRGLIHAATILDDGLVTGLTPERIARALEAKSLGAWNLHLLTKDMHLDFFTLYSSATTPFGNPGQAAYVAGNCMLESLAAWRRSRDLPAQVIGWGAIGDTGMITRNPKARDMLLKVLGISPTSSKDALYWLEHCIATDIGTSYYFGLDWQSRADIPILSAPRFSCLRPGGSSSHDSGGPSLEDIRALPPKEGQKLLASLLIAEISHVLRLPKYRLAPDALLVAQGMDSLMGVELGMAIEQKFGLTGYNLALSEKTTAISLAESLYAAICGSQEQGGGSGQGSDEEMVQTLAQKHGVLLSEQESDAVLQGMKEEQDGN